MTPEERDRLAVVESQIGTLVSGHETMNEKLDQLIAAANMGKGAWWMLLKLGGLLILLVGLGTWAWEHLKM